MSKHIGRQIKLGIGKETTRGTAVTPDFWVKAEGFAHDDRVDYDNAEGSIGSLVPTYEGFPVKQWAEGGFRGLISDDHFGLILLGLLGAVADSTVETGVYDHDYTLAEDVQHQSLTLVMEEPNQEHGFALAMLTSLELKFELGKLPRYTANFMSQKGDTVTETASFSAENKFRPHDFAFGYADDIAGLSSSTALSVKSLTLKFETNVTDDQYLGNIEPEDFLNQELNISGTVELLFENDTHLGWYQDGTHKALEISLTRSDVTIGAASNPTLTIQLAKCQFDDWSREKDLGAVVAQTLEFNCHYSLADSQVGNITLRNTVAAY